MILPMSAMALDYTLTTGATASYFGSDGDAQGKQIYIPLSLSTTYTNWSFEMATALMANQAENDMDADADLTGLSDTSIGIAYTRKEGLPVDLMLCLDLSLPTGKTDLDREDAGLFTDSDLYLFKPYGEGINVNPSVIAARSWDKWSVAGGIGYNIRGKYDHNEGMKNYDPGDILILTAEADYEKSEEWSFAFYGEYGIFSQDKLDGSGFHQQGDFFLAGCDAHYIQSSWEALCNVEMILRTELINDDEIKLGVSPEDRKNTGDEIKLLGMYRRFLDDKSSAKGFLEIRHLNANDYKKTDTLYFGKRDKIRAGGAYTRELSSDLSVELGAEFFIMAADKSYFNTHDRTFHGLSLGVLLTRRF